MTAMQTQQIYRMAAAANTQKHDVGIVTVMKSLTQYFCSWAIGQ
jgi:hypothetical protein